MSRSSDQQIRIIIRRLIIRKLLAFVNMGIGDTHQSERIAFGEAIVAARKHVGLSQEQLANASQIDRSYMGRIERGEQSVSFDKILDLCGALGLEPAALFGTMVKNLSRSEVQR